MIMKQLVICVLVGLLLSSCYTAVDTVGHRAHYFGSKKVGTTFVEDKEVMTVVCDCGAGR